MANIQTNLTQTQIAVKRLSGKAMTNIESTIAQEKIGSTIQTAAGSVFGENIPTSPNSSSAFLYLIQSSSNSDPGTVQLVEFDITSSGVEYSNDTNADAGDPLDQGETTVFTYHAYALRLTGSYEAENAAVSSDFDNLASTNVSIGTFPFSNDAHLSGSIGKLQIIPEYLGTTPAGSPNPYEPVLIANNGAPISPGADIDWYLDPYSGMLFVQDPVDYEGAGDQNLIPNKLRAFIYTGKYQDEVVSGDTVDLHINASEGTGFSLANAATASFESGSAGVTVTAGAINTITIGANTDNVTFNSISGSFSGSFEGNGSGLTDIPSSSLSNVVFTNLGDGSTQIIEGGLTLTGDITAEQFVVSSSVTYMTQSFSSGSTIFGDSLDDTHQFTGSLFITGVEGNASQIPLVYDATTGEIHTGSAYALSADGMTQFKVSGSSGGFDVTDGNTVSFVSGAGDGLTVTAGSPDTVTFTLVGVFSGSSQVDITSTNGYSTFSSSLATDIATNATNISTNAGNISTNATDISNLETSASAGIRFEDDNSGFSTGLAETASFAAAGAGLAVEVDSNAVTYTITPDDVLNGATDTSTFNFTSSQAANASTITVTDNENGTAARPIVFHDGTATGTVNLESDASTFTYTPEATAVGGPQVSLGQTGGAILALTTHSLDVGGDANAEFTLGNSIKTINLGGAGTTLVDIGRNDYSGDFTHTTTITGKIELISTIGANNEAIIASGGLDLNLNHPDSGSFIIRNISASTSEVTPLVIDGNGNVFSGPDYAQSAAAGIGNFQILTGNTSPATFVDITNTGDDIIISGSANEIEVTNDGSNTITIGLPNNVTIAGDLTVQGTTTTLNTANLLVEDRYILLGSSSADNNVGGGIIVQKATTGTGTALHWDDVTETWAVDIAGADASTATAKAIDGTIAFVSRSAGLPGAGYDAAVIVGATNDYKKGQFYVDTSDAYGLYVYL